MRCYYHQEKEAVGACKSCGKGLCPDCAADVGKGLACRGRCEEDVRAVVALVDRNIKLSPQMAGRLESSRKVISSAALFNVVVGCIFVGWGFLQGARFGFLVILGFCFLVYGVFGLFQARRTAKAGKPISEASTKGAIPP
jgi:hypothetical protein